MYLIPACCLLFLYQVNKELNRGLYKRPKSSLKYYFRSISRVWVRHGAVRETATGFWVNVSVEETLIAIVRCLFIPKEYLPSFIYKANLIHWSVKRAKDWRTLRMTFSRYKMLQLSRGYNIPGREEYPLFLFAQICRWAKACSFLLWQKMIR